MIKTIELSDSHHMAWDKFCDDAAVLRERENRFLNAAFKELGGEGQFQFDYVNRRFLVLIPDAKPDAGNPSKDSPAPLHPAEG